MAHCVCVCARVRVCTPGRRCFCVCEGGSVNQREYATRQTNWQYLYIIQHSKYGTTALPQSLPDKKGEPSACCVP